MLIRRVIWDGQYDEQMTNVESRMSKQDERPYPVIRASSFLRHSSFVLRHFYLIPDLIQFFELSIAQLLSPDSQLVFQAIKTRHELIRRLLECAFCIEPALAREIHDGEKQIADLIGD